MYFCRDHQDVQVSSQGKGCPFCQEEVAKWQARKAKKRQDRKDRLAAIEEAKARGER